MGLGVLIDWVPPTSRPMPRTGVRRHALLTNTPTRARASTDWNTAIYNFGRTEVQPPDRQCAVLAGAFGGRRVLRVDAVASMLYRDYSREAGQWMPNVHRRAREPRAIALMRASTSWSARTAPAPSPSPRNPPPSRGVSAPTYAGGLGFHYKWNMGWMNDTLATWPRTRCTAAGTTTR